MAHPLTGAAKSENGPQNFRQGAGFGSVGIPTRRMGRQQALGSLGVAELPLRNKANA